MTTTFSFDSLVFAPRAPAIVVTLILMHGDNDALTRSATSFPNSEEGRADVSRLLAVLEKFPELLKVANPFNREDLQDELEDEFGVSPDFFKKHVNPLLEHDTTYTDDYAKPMAYLVEVFDSEGKVRRAMFPDYYGAGMVGMRCFGTLLHTFYPEAAWPTA